MADVLIYADTIRSPEMRHEVPLAVPDAFLYAEKDGQKSVVLSSFELDRLAEVAPGLNALPYEEFGIDELYAQGLGWLQPRTARVCRTPLFSAVLLLSLCVTRC